MSFEMIPDLLANILEEQKRTNDALVALAKSLAVAAEAQRYREQKAIVAEPPMQAPVEQSPELADPQQFYLEAAEAIKELAKARGRDAATQVLEAHGLTNLKAVPQPEWPRVLPAVAAAAREALAA